MYTCESEKKEKQRDIIFEGKKESEEKEAVRDPIGLSPSPRVVIGGATDVIWIGGGYRKQGDTRGRFSMSFS